MSALDLGPLNAFAAENDLPPAIVESVVLHSLNGKPALELPGDGRPMITWSKKHTCISLAASTMRLVTISSARLGLGSPDG